MLNRFAPISKMEALPDGTLKVWGVASTEAVDSDGEVIKSAAMKEALPDYMQWGAIREMHQPIAAGTCLEASVNEETGQTIICAHVVDESSVKKVQKGVLKGFSIGGVATATDPLNKTIVTALKLNEISLVDKPANPEAVITLWKSAKMDKTTQEAPVTGEQVGNEIESLVKGGDLSLQEVLQAVRKAAKGKKEAKCMHDVKLGESCDKCDGGVAMAKAADTEDEPDEFCKKDYSDKEREDMAASGEAEEDGSYPIKNKKDLKNAIRAIGRSKDEAKTKKHIKARAKALGLESELPDDWKETKKVDGGENADESGKGEGKEKGAVAPAGGSNEPAGDEGKEKAAQNGNGAASVEKAEGNAAVKPVSPGTQGAPNATNAQPQMGTEGTMNPQANTPMLQKPKVGDLVTVSWGEDEVGGHIADIKDLPEGGSEVVVKNGDAHLAVDSSKLTHHELNGDKVHWKVVTAPENGVEYTTAKAAQAERITAALKKAFKGDKVLQKGMWTVGNWADITQSLVWLMKDIKWEAASEEDAEDDDFVKRIAAVVKSLGELMLEYAEDQLKEIFTGVCDPDNIPSFIIELAAKPGELQKFAEGGVGVGHVLKKAFGAAGAHVDTDAVERAIEKAVKSQVSAATATLEKAHSEHVQKLEKRIKELEDQPQEIRGVLKGTAISKDSNLAEGAGQEVQPVLKNGKVDDAATEFKKAFQNPQSFNRLSTQ